jgi:hypothetical protein
MIHLTLIIVDFLTGLLAAGAWALASAGGVIAAHRCSGNGGAAADRHAPLISLSTASSDRGWLN